MPFHPVIPSSRHPVILLVGYRGTGKTTVGQLLAKQLGWNWIDADVLLEQRHGKSIRQIFAEEGESAFRDKESALLGELSEQRECVIATGGGIILREANRRKLQSAGHVIWLRGDAETLYRRIQGDETTADRRPNLAGGGLAEVEQLLAVREPLYREVATLIVDTMERTPEAVAESILAELQAND